MCVCFGNSSCSIWTNLNFEIVLHNSRKKNVFCPVERALTFGQTWTNVIFENNATFECEFVFLIICQLGVQYSWDAPLRFLKTHKLKYRTSIVATKYCRIITSKMWFAENSRWNKIYFNFSLVSEQNFMLINTFGEVEKQFVRTEYILFAVAQHRIKKTSYAALVAAFAFSAAVKADNTSCVICRMQSE